MIFSEEIQKRIDNLPNELAKNFKKKTSQGKEYKSIIIRGTVKPLQLLSLYEYMARIGTHNESLIINTLVNRCIWEEEKKLR